MTDCDIGLMGLAVMGQNLVLNMAEKGYTVAVYNRTTSKVDEFVNSEDAQPLDIIGAHCLEELVARLKRPRKIMLMIKSGDAVPAAQDRLYPGAAAADAVIEQLIELMEPGDIII
ncbi:MAG: NAD(P)-binding domain-containing protein, partial [Arenicellales bacterium]|nr:NAD(P)-binding domain-containing protein [Arenicellales bacterium]